MTEGVNQFMKNLKSYLFTVLILMSLAICQDAGTISAKEAESPTFVTIHAEDAYLPSILRILAKESGYNIVTDPNVNSQDKISIHLDDVPIQEAINLVVRAVGLGYEVVGNSFLIAEPKKLAEEVGITAHVIELKYANASEVKTILQDLTDKIQVDVSGNKLLINASPKKIGDIKDSIKKIDVPTIQILMEVRLIEVAADAEEKFGIDWSKLAHYTNIFAETGVIPGDLKGAGSLVPGLAQNPNTEGTGVVETYAGLPFAEVPSDMPFNRLSEDNLYPKTFSRQMTAFDVTLDFLLKNNDAEILADSKLVTLNGREAYIEMVDVVPYILSSGGVGGQVQVQKEEVGIKLNVLPSVNTDGDITVKVQPEVSSIFEFIGPDKNIPRVKRRASSSVIRVKDGGTIVIGGLISRDRKNTIYKVPLLHRIPWIGEKIFTSKDVLEKKMDLIIQITPSVVTDDMAGIAKSAIMLELERSLYIPEETDENGAEETPDDKKTEEKKNEK